MIKVASSYQMHTEALHLLELIAKELKVQQLKRHLLILLLKIKRTLRAMLSSYSKMRSCLKNKKSKVSKEKLSKSNWKDRGQKVQIKEIILICIYG